MSPEYLEYLARNTSEYQENPGSPLNSSHFLGQGHGWSGIITSEHHHPLSLQSALSMDRAIHMNAQF